jgi:uncharacterized membrane protein YdbT with pleckstrin-like domain
MASYLEKVLQPGETVRYTGRIHWVVYLGGIFVVVLGVGVLALVGIWVPHEYAQVAQIGGAALAIIGVLQLLGAWFRRWTTELAVTDRRIIFKRGFISRRTIEMNMDKVESVDVDQGILGRIFDYGDITVRGTGSGLEPMRAIDDPLAFRNHVTAA